MKFYLAARYGRYHEIEAFAKRLRELGHPVCSRWHLGNHQVDDNGLDPLADPLSMRFAQEDWQDLLTCDTCLSFTEQPRTLSRGGRHVEFGAALALGKHVWICGPKEHVFHCLPQVQHFATADSAYVHIACIWTPASYKAGLFKNVV